MEPQSNPLKGFVVALSVALPVLLLAGVGGTYYVMSQKNDSSKCTETASSANENKATPTPTPVPAAVKAEFKTYTDPSLKFSLRYPSGWEATEEIGLPEGTGISLINVKFAVDKPGSDSTKHYNALTIETAYAGDSQQSLLDQYFYNPAIKDLQGSPQTMKFGVRSGKKWPEQPGMASAVIPYIYKEGKLFIKLSWDRFPNDGQDAYWKSSVVTEAQINQILQSFQFMQ